MRTLLVHLALAGSSLLAHADSAKGTVYRIRGVAVDGRSGAPIPYCRMQGSDSAVTEQRRRQRTDGSWLGNGGIRQAQDTVETEADAQGRFQLVVSHPGAWTLSGSARNYRRQALEAHDGFSAAVVLTPAQNAVEVVLRMQRDATVEGQVLDEAGEPVRGAQVTVEAQRTPERGARAGSFGAREAGVSQTDDRGHYEVDGLAPGLYRLHVQAQPWYAQTFSRSVGAGATTAPLLEPSLDLVYPTLWYPGVPEESAAEPLQLASGDDRKADFQLVPTPAARLILPRVPLTLTEGEGRPQRNSLLVRVSLGAPSLATLSSASNGNSLQFTGLQPGLYEIYGYSPDGQPDGEPKQIRIAAGGSTLVDPASAERLTRVTLVSDRTGEANHTPQVSFVDPVSGRVITDRNNNPGLWNGGQGGSQHAAPRYVFLPPGTWQVRLVADQQDYLTGLTGSGLTIQGATITVGEEPASLLLHLGSGRGSVLGSTSLDDKPVVGAMVLLVPASLGEPDNLLQTMRAETNTDGSFDLHGVAPGKYILLAIAHGWDIPWQNTSALLPYLTHGIPVVVAKDAKQQQQIKATEP